MNSFIKSEIQTDFDLISSELKKARQKKKISLEAVSEKTKINKKYLSALESGDFSVLPKGIYGRKFLKEYADFLEIGFENIEALFEDEPPKTKENKKDYFSNRVVQNKYFLSIPGFIRKGVILLVVGLCFSYLAFSFKKITSEPALDISNPPKDFITDNKSVEIIGYVEDGADVTINGESILVNIDNSFYKELKLKEGLNEVVVEAKKKYGKTNLVKRQILVKK